MQHISDLCIVLCMFRDLENLIFQSGIQLEELKEWIEESKHDQIVEPTLSDLPHALQPCASLKETEPQPEVLYTPSLAHSDTPEAILLGSCVTSGSHLKERQCEKNKFIVMRWWCELISYISQLTNISLQLRSVISY